MLLFVLLETLYLTILILLGGWSGLVVSLIQSTIAIFMLEAVSYVEHYGLVRQTLPNGRYGNMSPAHSWDSYHRFSNYLEFHLQRHADHHAAPTKSFSALQPHVETSPRLPAGYPTMVVLAMVPVLWRRVMDSRLGS
jgi:alkane 1-monooxygenase